MLDLRSAAPDQAHRDTDHSTYSPGVGSVLPRRFASWLVLVTLLSLTAMHASAAHADTVVSSTATVTSPDGLNLRSAPATSASVVAVMPSGAVITITGSGTPDNWLPVQFNTLIGWANGSYLSVSQGTPVTTTAAATVATATPAAASAPAATVAASVLSADGLNLRSGPGTSFSVLTIIPGGSAITITGAAQSAWLPITFGSFTGWIDGTYVSADGSSPMISSNAAATSAGASIASPSGSNANRDAANAATPTPSPNGSTAPTASATPAAATKLIWPDESRKISTVFSPSHLGVDIDEFPSSGRPLGASAAGTVSFAGGDSCCSYGLYIIIDHADGMQTLYAHLSVIGVQKGQQVTQGQRIGVSGCTGKCTGPHIHYEVRLGGKQVDPLRYLPPPWSIE